MTNKINKVKKVLTKKQKERLKLKEDIKELLRTIDSLRDGNDFIGLRH